MRPKIRQRQESRFSHLLNQIKFLSKQQIKKPSDNEIVERKKISNNFANKRSLALAKGNFFALEALSDTIVNIN